MRWFCDRDAGDPAGPGCDDANVARMCNYYLGGNQQHEQDRGAADDVDGAVEPRSRNAGRRCGQPVWHQRRQPDDSRRRRGPLPPRPRPEHAPRGEREQREGSQRADVGQRPRRPFRGSLGSRKRRSHPQERARIHHQRGPRPRSGEFSVYASLAFPVARRWSRPEPSPARCFSIASLLTPPTATPRFGLPMLSGGPGVRAGSSFRYLGPAGTLLRPASTRRRAETAETGAVRLMTQRRQPHRGSQSMITITADKRSGRG